MKLNFPFGSCEWFADNHAPALSEVEDEPLEQAEDEPLEQAEAEIDDRDMPIYIITDQDEAGEVLKAWRNGDLSKYF